MSKKWPSFDSHVRVKAGRRTSQLYQGIVEEVSVHSKFGAALVGGEKHRNYLLDLGMRADQICFGYDVVDNNYFTREVRDILTNKDETGWLPGRRYILFCQPIHRTKRTWNVS